MSDGRRSWIWWILFGCLGLLLAHHETLLTQFRFTQNDLGDTRFNHYILEHGYRWLRREPLHRSFFDPPYFYPARNVAAYSDVLLGAAPLYWIWRALSVPADTAFQLWVLTLSLANYVAFAILARRGFGATALGSASGAALFAFAGARINQTMHHQLFPHFWSAVAILGLIRALDSAQDASTRRRGLWVFFLSGVAQLWSGFYLAWFLAYGLAIALLVALVERRGRLALWGLLREFPVSIALAAGTSAVALAPYAMAALTASQEVGMRSFQEVLGMVPRPQSWLDLGPASWLYGWTPRLMRGVPMEHEQRLGVGLLTTALIFAGFWRARRDARLRLVGVSGLLVLCSATLFWRFTPWQLVYELFPAAQAIRAVSRIGLLLLVPGGLGLAYAIDALAASPRRAMAFSAPLLALASLLEQGQTTPAFDKHQNREDIAQVAAAIDPSCQAFLFSPVQGYGPYWKYQLDAMWAQLSTGVPTLNGYSGNNPPGWGLGDTNLHTWADEQRVAAALNAWAHARGLPPASVCWVRVAFQEGPYRGVIRDLRLPTTMTAGALHDVSLSLVNTGELTFRRAEAVRLGSHGPPDNFIWGRNRVDLPHDVAPGESVELRFQVRAPAEPGRYPMQWRPVRDGVMWFGALSPRVEVNVVSAGPADPAPRPTP